MALRFSLERIVLDFLYLREGGTRNHCRFLTRETWRQELGQRGGAASPFSGSFRRISPLAYDGFRVLLATHADGSRPLLASASGIHWMWTFHHICGASKGVCHPWFFNEADPTCPRSSGSSQLVTLGPLPSVPTVCRCPAFFHSSSSPRFDPWLHILTRPLPPALLRGALLVTSLRDLGSSPWLTIPLRWVLGTSANRPNNLKVNEENYQVGSKRNAHMQGVCSPDTTDWTGKRVSWSRMCKAPWVNLVRGRVHFWGARLQVTPVPFLGQL